MPEISNEKRIRLSQDLMKTDLGPESIVLHLASGTYFSLNSVGATLWNWISDTGNQGIATQTLSHRLLEAFDTDEEQAAHDLNAFIASLETQGLIQWC